MTKEWKKMGGDEGKKEDGQGQGYRCMIGLHRLSINIQLRGTDRKTGRKQGFVRLRTRRRIPGFLTTKLIGVGAVGTIVIVERHRRSRRWNRSALGLCRTVLEGGCCWTVCSRRRRMVERLVNTEQED
jgi:hypothetical protein